MIIGNYRVTRLLLAIAHHEGYFPPGVNGYENGSIAWRNKNPGNLRWSPYEIEKRNGFSVFESDMMGWYALYWDIFQKAHGQTRTKLNGESTVEELIRVWAPPEDNNNTEKYIESVEKNSGISRDEKLNAIFERE
jgi:hypothetical protein